MSPWIFLSLLIGFTIRVPLVPFHTWLPDANSEAPTSVTVLLCGVGLKCGCYGYLRFLLPLFPDACAAVADVVTTVAIAGMLYAALLALAQTDLKRVVAYACLSQIGLCVAGIFSMNSVGVAGGLLQLVNHGISAGAILYLIGLLEHRYQTRDMRAFGGLACLYPRLGLLFTLVTLSLIGVPGLNGFAGETLTLMGVFQGTRLGGANAIGAACGLAGSLLIAWVFLRVLQMVFRGPSREPVVDLHDSAGLSATETNLLISDRQRRCQATDLTNTEVAALLPAIVLIVWIGLAPQFFLSRIEPSVLRIVNAHKTTGDTAANSPDSRLKHRLKHGVAGVEAESSERSPQFFTVWEFPSVVPSSSFKTTSRRGVAGVDQREPPAFATSGGSAALRPQPPPSFETVSSDSDETAANLLENGESDRSSRIGRTTSR